MQIHVRGQCLKAEIICLACCKTIKHIFHCISSYGFQRFHIVWIILTTQEHPVACLSFRIIGPGQSDSSRVSKLCFQFSRGSKPGSLIVRLYFLTGSQCQNNRNCSTKCHVKQSVHIFNPIYNLNEGSSKRRRPVCAFRLSPKRSKVL